MRNLTDHVARMGADPAATQNLAVAGCRPGEQTFRDLDALRLGLVIGEADPGQTSGSV